MSSVIKPFLDLCRVSNLPSVWTNTLAALLLSSGFHLTSFVLLGLSMSFFYCGGMCLNDILDAQLDRIHRPLRPIPSGKLSLRSAIIFTGILFTAALALLLWTSYPGTIKWGFLLLALIVAYDKWHKDHPISILLMGGCRWMIFIVVSAGAIGLIGKFSLLAGFFQFSYVLILSAVARYENSRREPFSFPLIPVMIAGISILDGVVLAILVAPVWFLAGIGGALMTQVAQRFIRGD